MYNNHFAIHLKLTQHCKSTILRYKIKIEKNKVTVACLKKRTVLLVTATDSSLGYTLPCPSM